MYNSFIEKYIFLRDIICTYALKQTITAVQQLKGTLTGDLHFQHLLR